MQIPFSLSVQVTALIVSFVFTIVTGLALIPILRKLRFGQTVREDGPVSHYKKTGTPTMGGIIFLIPITLLTIYCCAGYPRIIPLTLVVLGFGFVGFIDDYLKAVKKNNDGLSARQKMLGILAVATAFTLYAAYNPEIGTSVIIPFAGIDATYALPLWFYIPFTIFVLASITNAVNLTDGLDGLCAGVTLIVMVFFTIVSMTRSEWDHVKVFSSIVTGGCLGFLAFNLHPARVFMGDTGSLALGGAVGAVSVITRMPWILLVVGFIYVIEVLSDIIQVVSFKTRRKRVFKMAPIHHHFELSGWKETNVVKMFWIVTVIMCFAGFLVLRIRI